MKTFVSLEKKRSHQHPCFLKKWLHQQKDLDNVQKHCHGGFLHEWVSLPWKFSFDAQLQIQSLMFPYSKGFLKCGSVPNSLLSRRIKIHFSQFIFLTRAITFGVSTNVVISFIYLQKQHICIIFNLLWFLNTTFCIYMQLWQF